MKCPFCNFETKIHKRGLEAVLELTTFHWRFARGGDGAMDPDDYLVCPTTGKPVKPRGKTQEHRSKKKGDVQNEDER